MSEQQPKTIRDYLNSPAMIAELARVLPSHCKPERMARVAMTALTRIPKLTECDQASFFQALLSLSQWGLEPDGRRAHLIPFENRKRGVVECQLIIDYKGLVELAYRSGVVRNIHADVVREGDLFDYNLGRVLRHVPWFLRRDQRPEAAGEIFAAFCQVELRGGRVKCEIMSREAVEAIRGRSRAGQNGPWVTDWEEMAKKTCFRRASKWLPLSAELVDVMEGDDDRLIEAAPKIIQSLPLEPQFIMPTRSRTDAVAAKLGARPNGPSEAAPATQQDQAEPPDGPSEAAPATQQDQAEPPVRTDGTPAKPAARSTSF